ncbi:MAG: hypothetical protein RBU30_27925 [Polyangia bacterium]|jgi:hypothetical protein|nr:hypothetical protein [Polyangia bacterium]
MRVRSIGEDNFDAYVCVLNLRWWRLQLLLVNDGEYTLLAQSEDGSVLPDPDDEYHLRMRVVGSAVSCSLLPDGPVLSREDETFSTGTVGFFTHRVSTCFDYLLVYAP